MVHVLQQQSMKIIFKLSLAEIKAMRPRPDLWAFAKSCDGDMQKFWDTCPNGDWLLWLLRKTQNLGEMDARRVGLAYAKKVLCCSIETKCDDKEVNELVCSEICKLESFLHHHHLVR